MDFPPEIFRQLKVSLRSGRGTAGRCTRPNWSKMEKKTTILAKLSSFRTLVLHFHGPRWPEEDHFGPFGSANRSLATPDFLDKFFESTSGHGRPSQKVRFPAARWWGESF